MTMFNKDQIFQLLESRDGEALRALWQGRGAVDIAALLDSVEDGARQAAVFRTLPKDLAADVFSYLPGPTQATLARSFADGELQQIFDALHLDDAADFLEELPANLVTRILRSASPQRRMAVNALLRYPADSAGSVMTPEFVSLRPGDTVRQALDTIRRTGIHKETVYTCYVLEHRQLLGVVSAKDLLTAAEDAAVADLMVTDVVSVGTLTDREEAARLLAKYDLLALPVLDGEERMVGIVTVDDAMDVLTEAAAEDLSIMAAVTPDEKPYFAASAWEHARHRVVWLLILMLSAAITGSIITRYEDAISAVPLLVAFLPMLMDTGGNCGSQSATLVIRGLALEEIRPRDALRVIRKELAVAAIVSAVLAAANGLRIYPVPGGHGGAGQAGGLYAAHCRQAAPHGSGHHGLPPHHYHCGCRGGADLLPGRRRAPAPARLRVPPGTGAKQVPARNPAGTCFPFSTFTAGRCVSRLGRPSRRRSAGHWERGPAAPGAAPPRPPGPRP